MRILTALALATLLGGCAAAQPAPPGAQTFSGQVWNWDERESTVTLAQDGGLVRVKTTPDQLSGLRLHERARVTGTVAPPSDLVVMKGTSGPVNAVPKGQAELIELRGTVASVDPGGRIVVNSERGPVQVWGASGAASRFAVGAPVVLRASVQPVDLVPAPAAAAPAPAPVGATSASPSSEPGDHAVVTGRVIRVDPGGMLVVESPTGPIQVPATSGRYNVGEAVQVRTTVRAGI
jgi:hypothetical protein